MEGHEKQVSSLAIDPTNSTIASGSFDKTVKLWNLNTLKCIKTLEDSRKVRSIVFSLDGKKLISGGGHDDNDSIRVWEIDRTECWKDSIGHQDSVVRIVLVGDGKTLISASKDLTLKVWDLEKSDCVATLVGHTDSIRSLASSSDGKTLISTAQDKSIKLWDIQNGECFKTLQGHTSWITSVKFSRDGCQIVSGRNDGVLNIWDIVSKKRVNTLQGNQNGSAQLPPVVIVRSSLV